jgi:hypothetical protein
VVKSSGFAKFKYNHTVEIGNPDCQIKEPNPITSCLNEAFLDFHTIFSSSPNRVEEYCRVNCSHIEGFDSGWERFCNLITSGSSITYQFHCLKNDFTEAFYISKICDGITDCSNQADEIGCPGRFYCNPNKTSEWVAQEKVCNNVKDCFNGTDECGTCQTEALSSAESLIRSKIIIAMTIAMGILIITINVTQGYKCFITTCSSKVKSIDKIFLMQIFFHDALMGVYLCSIFVATIVLKLKGNYCLLEVKWRASSYCSALGILFSFSSHGSLLAIASVSITRFLTCRNLVADIKKKAVITASSFLAFLNLVHSCLPLLPSNILQEIFRTDMFFTNLDKNPFFNKNPINRSRLAFVYEGLTQRKATNIYTIIDDLRNVTTEGEIFDVMEISYYGNTGLCVHNIFKPQESYKVYKLFYCTIVFLLLCIVSTAYITIIIKQRQSNNAVASNEIVPEQGPDSTSARLTLKVALMIGSQLICWIPFILTVLSLHYIANKPASPLVFEAFALLVIPINSFLNPIFYSELYKKVAHSIWVKWRQFVSFFLARGHN